MKSKKIYIIPILSYRIGVSVDSNAPQTVPLTWIDGQTGVCPVFTNKRKAMKYLKYLNKGATEHDLVEGFI